MQAGKTGWVAGLLGFALALCFPLFAYAPQARALEMHAWVDKTSATLEDQIILKVSISGKSGLPRGVTLPPLPDFDVREGGTSQQTKIAGREMTRSKEFTFLLQPRTEGDFTIGSIRTESKGREYRSDPIRVRIRRSSAQGTPEEGRPAVYVTQEVDNDNPYVHQQILYTFRFYRRLRAVDAQWDPPEMKGFWVEDLGQERQSERVIGGVRYLVTEINKALFPDAEGLIEIPESTLTCKVVVKQRVYRGLEDFFADDFFNSPLFGNANATTKVLRAPPVSIRVRPLPETGKPEGFQGLVGSFRLNAEVGEKSLKTGDSTTLTVTVRGEGNLRDLVDLPLGDLPEFKIYPDKPSFELSIQGDRVEGAKVFKKALVPLKAGLLEVPALRLAYFDPNSSEYRYAETDIIELSVEEGSQDESLHLDSSASFPRSKRSVRVLGQDILPIHTGMVGARDLSVGRSGLFLLVGFLLPPGVFFLLLGTKKRRERLETDRHILRRKQARKQAMRSIKQARREMTQPDGGEFMALTVRALKGFVGDKCDLAALAMTPEELHRVLKDRGLGDDLAGAFRELLEEAEYCQYVPSVPNESGSGAQESLYRRARKLISELDRKL